MDRKSMLLALMALFAAALLSACTGVVAAKPQPQTFDLQATSHVAMGLSEQDVFIEREADSGQVVRIAAGEEAAVADMPVYATAAMVEHDLFATGDAPFGPFEKGQELGMTMGDWLAASGAGSYTVIADRAMIDMQFENLVPNGVYSVWCSRVTLPPNIEVVDKACGAADGSQNTFIVDEQGNAQFELELASLPVSTPETSSVIAIAYHSDGQTYGPHPGDFGLNSHVHLAAMIPVSE